jgi:hypothetical protein
LATEAVAATKQQPAVDASADGKVDAIVDAIARLSLLETSQLIQQLKVCI